MRWLLVRFSEYYNNVAMGFVAYFKAEKINTSEEKKEPRSNKEKLSCAIVFG